LNLGRTTNCRTENAGYDTSSGAANQQRTMPFTTSFPVDTMSAMSRPSAAADASSSLAVLVSGGLDSAILLAQALPHYPTVWPLYVRFGLFWEQTELHHLRHFLDAIRTPALRTLTILDMPVADLYGEHWSLTGTGVPSAGTPDDAVYLPGRNVLLLAKAMLWCHLHGVAILALVPLEGNPFPDATPDFFTGYEAIVNRAVGGTVRVVQPYRGLHKEEVLQRGRHLPLQWTFSCLRPRDSRHCGACNKCAERRQAFARAGYPDPATYHREEPCSA
jgi:7-cyano-7-deazaguanine synthase